MRKTVNILGVKVDKVTEKEALSRAKGFLKKEGVSKIYTPNPEIIMTAKEDSEFMEILNNADLCTADGIGVVYASKILKDPIPESVAGFDLSKLTEGDLVAHSDTLAINLPAPELFDVIINPSDYEVFVEKGKWSHEEIQAFQVQAKEQLRTHALQEDIIGKAKTEGKERLTNLFKTFGYKVVEVSIKE